jgi:hypothetical protein
MAKKVWHSSSSGLSIKYIGIRTQRVRWFRTFAMNVSQIYDNETPIELEIKVAKEAAN